MSEQQAVILSEGKYSRFPERKTLKASEVEGHGWRGPRALAIGLKAQYRLALYPSTPAIAGAIAFAQGTDYE